FGNKVGRIIAPAGQLQIKHEALVSDSGEPDRAGIGARQHPMEELPVEVLPYLFSSRYCEVDRMVEIAWSLFGNTPLGWPRVQAVLNWVHGHVTFGYAYA